MPDQYGNITGIYAVLAVESSNLALKLNATGGIFYRRRHSAKNLERTPAGYFLEHFIQVGRLRPLIETVPVHVVLNSKAVLLGAAYYGKC
ncbi:MAG: glucokinase [Lewinellaceae bacterium]|nr:glucokinase [Lewinellaceae bacterium]